MSAGGRIGGDTEPLPASVKLLREIEPGLSVVSINGSKPEFLVSAEWVIRQRGDALAAFDAALRLPVETWEGEGGDDSIDGQ